LTLSEKEEKMLEDIISKRLRDSDIMSKDQDVSKFFLRQLRVLRRMAEKEGLSNKEILKLLNKNE
jgi:DNA-binding NarL/FixJ family response regulator